jgi:hypothetical protein
MCEPARVLLFSQRGLSPQLSRCFLYEMEDAITAVDEVDLLAPGYRVPMGERVLGELGYRVVHSAGRRIHLLRGVNPPLTPLRVDRHYELFFAVFQFAQDLPSLNALKGWRGRCAQAICLIDELWSQDLGRFESQLAILRQFDLILTHYYNTVDPLSQAIGRPVHYLAPGIDALRFFPGEQTPQRCIDVYNMGRRDPGTHAALLSYCKERDLFYLYDTFRGNLPVPDPLEHRTLLAEKLKRTGFFLANKAKVDEVGERGGQEEVGFRFFEGAAAGTVMIGDPPDVASFRENFDWPNAVVHLPYGSTEVTELLDVLTQDPERLRAIRIASVRNCLERHDWSERWSQILAWAGIAPTEKLTRRQSRLRQLAASLAA